MATAAGLDIVRAVMNDMWTVELRRHAHLELDWHNDPPRAVAWRAQGDLFRFAAVPVAVCMDDPGGTVRSLDCAISTAIGRLLPLTTSEALEAGELRRCFRG